jgi:hypothetical protein
VPNHTGCTSVASSAFASVQSIQYTEVTLWEESGKAAAAPCRHAHIHKGARHAVLIAPRHITQFKAAVLLCRDKCLALPGCTYCKNKFSPQPGSDGVCLSADQAKLLPAAGYECKSAAPQQQQQQHGAGSLAQLPAAGKQPAGGGDNCGKIREK